MGRGGGQGLGGGMSRLFAREGAKVAIAQRTEEKLAQTQADIEAAGGEVLALPADVSKPADAERLVAATVERFGGVDILNISSVHGVQGGETNSIYAATKGGIIGLTKALAQELAPFRIRVNAISPGAIKVHDSRAHLLAQVKPEFHAEMLARFGEELNPVHLYFQPLVTVGLPDDIAHGAVYLVSDEARFVTGQNLVIDGGVTTYLSNSKLERERIRAKEQMQEAMQAFIAEHGVDA